MAVMVALSVGLHFLQEARADAAAASLRAMIHVTATVLRDGEAKEMPLRELVPGDIIRLAAGDMVPSDVRVLFSKDIFVSHGSLTGESLPVEKFHDPETGDYLYASPASRSWLCVTALSGSEIHRSRRWCQPTTSRRSWLEWSEVFAPRR